jgi:hypothetical protein
MRNLISTQRVVRISHIVDVMRTNAAETLCVVIHSCSLQWEGLCYPGASAPEPLAASFAAIKPWRFSFATDQTCHRSMR